MPSDPERPSWYRPDVDGLRAVAVVLVVCFHAGLAGFAGGFIGVDVFFVISGYVIAALLLREHAASGGISWREFYLRRIRRLLPAATVMIAVVLVAGHLVLPAGNQAGVALASVAALTSTANVHYWWGAREGFVPTYFDQPQDVVPLLHTWSLSVEEQFYLAVPVAVAVTMWVARRTRWRPRRVAVGMTIAVSVASAALSWWLTGVDQSAAFYLPFTRAFEFGFGAIVAIAGWTARGVVVRTALGLAGAALLGLALVEPTPTESFPGIAVALPCLGVALLILARPAPLGLPPLAALGRVSYGWYLWHLPVLALAGAWNAAPLSTGESIVLLAVALGLAVVSYHAVEMPWRRATRRPRLRVVGVAGLALVLAAAGTGATSTAASTPPVSPWADFETAPDGCRFVVLMPMPTSGQRCELTRFDPDKPTLVLRGDSHAWQLVPALKAAREEHPDVNLVVWVLPGCPPLDLRPQTGWDFLGHLATTGVPQSSETWSQCVLLNHYARQDVARMARAGGVAVVAAARWAAYRESTVLSLREMATFRRSRTPDYDRLVVDLLDAGVTRLLETPASLTLVAPMPEQRRHVPRCLAVPGWAGRCDVSRSTQDAYLSGSATWLADLAGRRGDVRLIDVVDDICDDLTCPARSDGVVNYVDDSHLSASRSRTLAPHFADVFADLARARRQ